jgi:hypothetical protein
LLILRRLFSNQGKKRTCCIKRLQANFQLTETPSDESAARAPWFAAEPAISAPAISARSATTCTATTLRLATAAACSISCRCKSNAPSRLDSYPNSNAMRRTTETDAARTVRPGPHHEAVPKASHTRWKGFGMVRRKCRDKTHRQARLMRDAPWEHDRGEKPKGIGAQSVPLLRSDRGMDEKLMPKAIGKTACCRVVHWHVVKLPTRDLGTRLAAHRLDGRARPMSSAMSRRQKGDRSKGLTG